MFLFGPPNVEKMKARRDIRGLVKSLQYKKDWRIRLAAADALDQLGWQPENGDILVYYWLAREEWDKIDAPPVNPLINALKYDKKEVRMMSAKILGDMRNAQAVEALVAALHDRERDVRLAVIKALGQIGHARAVEPLIAVLLNDTEENTLRVAAATALGNTGVTDKRIAQVTFSLLESIRTKAAKAKDNFAICDYSIANIFTGIGPRIIPLLEAVIKETVLTFTHIIEAGNSGKIDLVSLTSLGGLGLGVGVFEMRDPNSHNIDGDLFFAAAEAVGLKKSGPMYVRPQPKTIMLETCIVALGNIGDSRAMESLIYALHDVRSMVRKHAAEALGECGDHRALDALKALLNDKDKYVSESAKEAIKKINQRLGKCQFCGKTLVIGKGVVIADLETVTQASQQMLARRCDCVNCGAIFCLECGNAEGHKQGTGATHCPKCGTKVPMELLM